MDWLRQVLRRLDPESYYDTKYVKVPAVRYRGRVLPGGQAYEMDVRSFFTNPLACELREVMMPLAGKCDDQKANFALEWVRTHVQYVSDWKQHNLPEFWMLPQETLVTRKGDCDDGAILIANLLDVPSWKVRLAAGFTKEGEGHCWLTYYCSYTKRWVALDWCYNPSSLPIRERPHYLESGLYKEVWFSWTRDSCWFGEAEKWLETGCEYVRFLHKGSVYIHVHGQS